MKEKLELFSLGVERIREFCEVNKLTIPEIKIVPKDRYEFEPCAYYRPYCINVCLEKCAFPATETTYRNWNWPGNTVDREPFGVLCHELGHYIDYDFSEDKSSYYGNFSKDFHKYIEESCISTYGNDSAHEWFAEMFRLYVTNSALLKKLKPKTYKKMKEYFVSVSNGNWRTEIMSWKTPPLKIERSIERKIEKVRT